MTSLKELKNKIKNEILINNLEINSFDIQSLAIKLNSSYHDIIAVFKLLYLEAESELCFNLYKSRNSVKIISIKPNIAKDNENLQNFYNISSLTKEEILFTSAPFIGKIADEDILDILNLYATILDKISDSKTAIYFAIENAAKLYNLVYPTYRYEKVEYLYNLIKDYGYSFERDNMLYWKTANSSANITESEIDDFFSVINRNKKEITEIKNPISPQREIEEDNQKINSVMTTHDALSLIAKELGISLDENESRQKLEELVAITNELILNFDELEDWEKLKNWDKFIKDWQAIMGEAMHDRN